MIEFRVEWQGAPSVRDPVLARTWCRLAIEADGYLVTHAIDQRAQSLRGGVYGSAFPLCRWIVENWWFLHHEACRFPRRYGSRDLSRNAANRAWVQRHSLLAAREGGALPDLMLFRDGEAIVARWLRDGADTAHPFLHFASEGQVRMGVEDATRGLARFVELVLGRVAELDAPEVEDLREDWSAISTATEDERELCIWSACLGIDPYDPDELTARREEVLRTSIPKLEVELRSDLLDVATADGLSADVEWLDEARAVALRVGDLAGPTPSLPQPQGQTAHETGYECARVLRQYLPMPNGGAVGDMCEVMQRLGWAQTPSLTTESMPASLLGAVLERSERGAAVVAAPVDESIERGRFRLARSLFLHHFAGRPGRRLLTAAHTWDQRASRAFAAEFLVPAAALSGRIGTSVSFCELDELADEYRVSPLVIEHQIENHRLGSLADS